MELEITPSMIQPLEQWIALLKRREPNWVVFPQVQALNLRLPVLLFPFLIAYVDETESCEIDVQRLCRRGREKLETLVSSKDRRTAFQSQHALDNFCEIPVGHFRQS